MKEFGQIETQSLLDHEMAEISPASSPRCTSTIPQKAERGEVGAQLTQAGKESLRSHSSEGQKASGKPDALFSAEQGNLLMSSVFRNANPSNLRGSLLEGNKDHLLNQARSDLAKQELHVESLNKCIGEPQRQTEEQRLALQDAQYGFVLLNPDENKFDYNKNYLRRKRFSEKLESEICTKREKVRELKNFKLTKSQWKN